MRIRQAPVFHGSDDAGETAERAMTSAGRDVAGETSLLARELRANGGATIEIAPRARRGRVTQRYPEDLPAGRSPPRLVREGSGPPGVAGCTREGTKDARRADGGGGGNPLLETSSMAAAMPQWRFFLSVLLPFAAGYYLSYLFRTINALISSDLAAELELSAADLGFLTSIYFLTFAAAQLPLGAMLDRYGPRAMQSVLLLIASAGALVFALAGDLFGLLMGRALLGIGVSLALMAGFKAIVLFLPPQRLAISNGWLVMLGALGAVTATAPAEMVVQAIGWRGLFAVLASLAAAAALLIRLVVPEAPEEVRRAPAMKARLSDVYRDRRFWRIAPLSAIGVGTSWSLQGLWASPWLRDVEGLNRTEIVAHLGVMAISVAASAIVLGMLADRMRQRGVSNGVLLAAAFGLSMAAQAGLLLGWPLPSYLLWSPIAAAGAATVLSFAMLAEYFPTEMSGRANAALNLLHIGAAFILQSAAGFIIACWPEAHGGYPAEAHRAAMACTLVLEIAAILWYAVPPRSPKRVVLAVGRAIGFANAGLATLRYRRAVWAQRAGSTPGFASGWGVAAAASALLFVAVAVSLSTVLSRPALAVYIVEAGDEEWAGIGTERGPEALEHTTVNLVWRDASQAATIRAAGTLGRQSSP
jgi:MFS family permease